ncbi:Ankyrin-3, partial [Rhizoclosmatium hyalinum]
MLVTLRGVFQNQVINSILNPQCSRVYLGLSVDPPFRLHNAVRDGKVEVVEELAQKLGHGQVDFRDEDGSTPLHLAAHYGLTKVATILLNYGADVNARGILDWTPLHRANNRSIALLLLDHGAKVNALDSSDKSPLYYAVCYGYRDIELSRLLLERGAYVDQMGDNGTPLIVSLKRNLLEHARLLISFKANVNVVWESKSPLSVAAERGCLDMVQLLVENGANANQLEYNESPLYLAIENNHRDVAKFLIQFGDSMQFQGNMNTIYNGKSALSVAAEHGHLKVVKVLMDNGAN